MFARYPMLCAAGLVFAGLTTACSKPSEQAQMQCIADYTVAYRLQQRALLESTPKPESLIEQTAAQTRAALMPDGAQHWSDCPKDFRRARKAANDKLAEMWAVMETMRGHPYDAAAFENLRRYAEAFEAEFLTFIAIYSDYLDDPRVNAAIGGRLTGPAGDVLGDFRP